MSCHMCWQRPKVWQNRKKDLKKNACGSMSSSGPVVEEFVYDLVHIFLFFDDRFLVWDTFWWISRNLGRESNKAGTDFSSNGFSTGSLHSDLNYKTVWPVTKTGWSHWDFVYFINILIICLLGTFRSILVITETHIFLEKEVFMYWSCLLFKH